MSLTPIISRQLFIDILQDSKVTKSDELQIFRFMYSENNHEATATDIAKQLEHQDKVAVIGIITRFAKRIIKNYDVVIPTGGERKIGLYELFFTGYWKGKFYVWQLLPVLIQALEELSLVDIESSKSLRNSFLFSWNPNNWKWERLNNNIKKLNSGGKVKFYWTCQSHKQVKVGDRAYIVRLGMEPTGIMASGYVASEPYIGLNWKDEETYVVDIEFDCILNPTEEDILDMGSLEFKFPDQHWHPEKAGISIKPYYKGKLEQMWENFLCGKILQIPESKIEPFMEGAVKQITQTVYERCAAARKACLEEFGYSCGVCGFDFEENYGSIGKNFIHVHHLDLLSAPGGAHQVNHIKQLRPVCPNCHAMLHKKTPPYTIEELKNIIELNNKLKKNGTGNGESKR